jgi:hypothetical protein
MKFLTLIVLVAGALTLVGCSIGYRCKETELQSVESPDGQTTAAVRVVNCGATTDFFTYVSIRTRQIPVRDKGLLFAYRGKPDLRITWASPKELKIECTNQCAESRIYRQVLKEEDYKVGYRGFTP